MLNRPNLFIDPSSALPDYSNSFRFQTLSGAVDIYRDKFGIPHILAHSTEDAFFGQGFATAQDRLFVMDHDRRWAYGRWAEVAGPSEGKFPSDDPMHKCPYPCSPEW